MDHCEATIDERMERLAREHPGGVVCHRLWYQVDAEEMHHIVDLRYGDDAWAATGTSLALAYVELRRKMEMGE